MMALAASCGALVLFTVLAAFAPDAPISARDRATEALARPALPTSYADALSRFDQSADNEDGFGDRLHLYISECYGECPEVEVIIDRARYGEDDSVRYRVVPWDMYREDMPWKHPDSGNSYKAYARATDILRRHGFHAMPRENHEVIDSSHIHLVHTLDGQTKKLIWAMSSVIDSGTEPRDEIERRRAVSKDLMSLNTAILHTVYWSKEEKEVLGGLLTVRCEQSFRR